MPEPPKLIISPTQVEEKGIILEAPPAFNRRAAHGAMISEGIEIANTYQCCHCGGHFLSVKGSGTRRAWCMNCMSITCGQLRCDPCLPFEKWAMDQKCDSPFDLKR